MALKGATRSSLPSLTSKGSQVSVHRREFVGSATNGATTGYSLSNLSAATPGYDLNPACNIMFPWLSQLAVNFERFRFSKVTVEVIPSQATTTAGRYYLAVDYDYDDPVPTTKVQLMGNMTAVEAPVWQPIKLTLDPKQLHRDMQFKYTSTVSRLNFVEPRTAYSGFLLLGFDSPTANLLFDVWITYDVVLDIPVNDAFANIDTSVFTPTSVANVASAVGTAVGRWPQPVAQLTGAIKAVVPGTPGTPNMVCQIGGTSSAPPSVLDIGLLNRQGALRILSDCFVSGTTISSVVGNGTFPNNSIIGWDGDGNGVGDMSSYFTQASGQRAGYRMDSVGGIMRSTNDTTLEALYAGFPTLRYIALWMGVASALGAGGSGLGIKYTS